MAWPVRGAPVRNAPGAQARDSAATDQATRWGVPAPRDPRPPPPLSGPSTDLETSEQAFGGAIGVRAMGWIDRTGNLVEFQDWYQEAYPFSLARLDMFQNLSTWTALDLGLRSPSDTDWGLSLGLRSLPYFRTEHHWTESVFYNLPVFTPTQRTRFWGDLDLRKYGQVPLLFWYDTNSLQGIGFDKDRSFLAEAYGFRAHGHTAGLDVDVDLPWLDYRDRLDPINDVGTRGFALSATRSFLSGHGDLQGSFRRTRSYLENLDRQETVDVYEFRGLIYEVFDLEGLKLDTRATYRDTPTDLQLTARTDNLLDAKALLAYTNHDGFSVQLGRERRSLTRQRLSRAGLDRLGRSALLRPQDLAAYRIEDEPRSNDWFGRVFFRFQPWFSTTYFQKETSRDNPAPTDTVRFHSPTLEFNRSQDRHVDFQLQPLTNIGVNLRLAEQTDRNLPRLYSQTVRTQQADAYWLLVNNRLNFGASWARLDILPTGFDVAPAGESTRSRGASLSYQLSPELTAFSDFTMLDTEGALSSVERIANFGLEAETGGRHRVSWRAVYTVDQMLNDQEKFADFDARGVVISGEAQF
ncbi:MAG: hypothetical protein HY814_07675 [Candidatus Riflebacteria bacterium]|nr:hypothetical protein [Candidatus Riflebacteria bacterium]